MSTVQQWLDLPNQVAQTNREFQRIVNEFIKANPWFEEFNLESNADIIRQEFVRTKLPFSALTYAEVVTSLVERGELESKGTPAPEVKATPELEAWVRDVYRKTSSADAKRLIHTDPIFKANFEAAIAAGVTL